MELAFINGGSSQTTKAIFKKHVGDALFKLAWHSIKNNFPLSKDTAPHQTVISIPFQTFQISDFFGVL